MSEQRVPEWRKVNLRADRYAVVFALANEQRRSVTQMVDLLLERALAGAEQARGQEASGESLRESAGSAPTSPPPSVAASVPAPASVPASGLQAGVVRGSDIAGKFKPLPREVQAKGRR